MTFNSLSDLIPIIAIFAAIFGLLSYIIKAQINMSKQFEPNGGTSMIDALNRIERDQRYLRDRLDTHIDKHREA